MSKKYLLLFAVIFFVNSGCATKQSANQQSVFVNTMPSNVQPVYNEGNVMYKDMQYASISGVDKTYLSLDLFLPRKEKNKYPLIVYLHGGAWKIGDKGDCFPLSDSLARGYAVACVNYRLSQIDKFPAQIHDAKSAVRWLRANADKYKLDANNFFVWGESAGGHIATLLAVSFGNDYLEGKLGVTGYSSHVQAAADWYGPTDFSAILPFKEKYLDYYKAAGQLMGGLKAELSGFTTDSLAKANPITYLDKNDPSLFIMHGVQDDIVPVEQSRLLYQASQKAGLDATYQELKEEIHAFKNPKYQKIVLDFFDKKLN